MTTALLAPFRAGVHQESAYDGLFSRVAARIVKFTQYRRTLAELQALADWQLRDLGIAGMDLRTLARKAAYGN
ncbi:DUF1127 domain-containing protein [Amaricoccus sp.]|uniref:DUF1127 domain-containing protein n=1 Tax=Amaricoccus sp. TaxID=1872485 RepID=UPI001B686BE5|nr:DUF1127 domain-containing protein [Amaricoccus sp.]MBP7242977.1 DUF1127 domain-containing protein [Amaricoccus sp.]